MNNNPKAVKTDNNMLRTTEYTKEKYFTSFFIGFLIFIVSVIPVIIGGNGYFIYYGDYNAQQIPFYNLINDAVRSGQFGWNWFTDLGSDLLTSYSFYNITSPFFWLTTLIPRAFVTYSMPFLLALKHGIASLTAYIYIRRFVRSKEACLVGALLYSYSGFQIFNIFFNHFHDVTAFFPLMLIAMEENICNRRRGWFAVIVAFMAILNYYFFAGQAVFLILYFFMRLPCRDFPVTFRKFLGLFAEAVLGVAISAVVLLPSAFAILGNYRVSQRLTGEDAVFYNNNVRILRIIQSFFLPAEPPAYPNLFKSEGARWSSIGGYFPLFSMLGVITFLRTRKKHWAARLSWICIFCAFIPILNSMFQMFNSAYYARWFYMPILIFAMMTAQTLDDEDADFKPAILINTAVMAFFGIISLLPEEENGKLVWFNFPDRFGYFWLTFGIATAMLLLAVYILYQKKKGYNYGGIMVYATVFACIVGVCTTVIDRSVDTVTAKEYVEKAVNGENFVYEEVSEDNFFRIDISEGSDNFPMLWEMPTIRAFQSVVSPSVMDFYRSIGIERDVASRPDVSHYTLRGLLSVKYFYREKVENAENTADSEEIMSTEVDIREYLKGFEYIGENKFYEIYENKLYIPIGFGYDTYVSEKSASVYSGETKEKMLIDSIILNNEQIEKYSDILTPATPKVYSLTENDYINACVEKQQNCSDSFKWDSSGFEAEISLDKPQLVFFSVPYSEGWTAKVNGKAVDVEKVSYGFMAVRAEEGENVITFSYKTPMLFEGAVISIGGIALLIIFVLICRKGDKKQKFAGISHYYDYNSCQKISAEEEYLHTCIKANSKNLF